MIYSLFLLGRHVKSFTCKPVFLYSAMTPPHSLFYHARSPRRTALMQEAVEAVKTYRGSLQEKLSRDLLIGQHEARRNELHRLLMIQRAEKEEKDRELRRIEQEEEEERERQKRKEDEALLSDQQERKEQVEQFRQQRAVEDGEKRQEAEAAEREREEELKRLIEENRPKVQHRQHLLQLKEEQKREREVWWPMRTLPILLLLNALSLCYLC